MFLKQKKTGQKLNHDSNKKINIPLNRKTFVWIKCSKSRISIKQGPLLQSL